MKLKDKRVLFLGGSTGIGAAAIRLFADEGASVVFGDVQVERGHELAADVAAAGAEVQFKQTDATDELQVQDLARAAVDALGGLDALVCVAGIASAQRVEEMQLEEWDRLLAVNARSCFLAAKHSVEHLRVSGGGAIVNTSSIAALRGTGAGASHYAASKGAVIGFTRALASELAPSIRVNCICPGHTRTGFNDPWFNLRGGYDAFVADVLPAVVPLQREADPVEIAQGLLFLASDASSFMTGTYLTVDGGFVR